MQRCIVQKIYTKDGITKENIFGGRRVLHLGCGRTKLPGSVGVDALSFPATDVVHDLNAFPWPFDEGSVDVIFAHSVLEHLDSLPTAFEEMYRVCKNGARIIIAVPYFRSVDAFIDPTHRHFFTSGSLDYFCDVNNSLSRYGYTPHTFKKIGFWYGWPRRSQNPFVLFFKRFINRHKTFYDQYLSILMPIKILVWELEVSK